MASSAYLGESRPLRDPISNTNGKYPGQRLKLSSDLHMHTYMHSLTHTHKHTDIHTRTHIHTHVLTHTCTHTHMHSHTQRKKNIPTICRLITVCSYGKHFFFFYFMWICLPKYMPYECRCLQKPEEDTVSPGAGVSGDGKLPDENRIWSYASVLNY